MSFNIEDYKQEGNSEVFIPRDKKQDFHNWLNSLNLFFSGGKSKNPEDNKIYLMKSGIEYHISFV